MKQFLLTLIYFVTCTTLVFAQREIRGKILDENNSPIIGATIIEVENTTNGSVTSPEGVFFLTLTNNDSQIKISSIGFASQTIAVSNNFISITLIEDVTTLGGIEIKGFPSVTGRARIRVKSIQSLPETTVAMTSETMDQMGIRNLEDFTTQVSNVTFNQAQQPGVNFMTVRGISQIRNGESPVAVVIDGMTLPDATIMNMSLYDVEMMELVKGPQGTLYGKNAIAGAVNIVTKEPSNEMRNKVTVSAGNGGMYGGQISSSGALSKDKLYYGIAAKYENFDGLINNTTLNKKVDNSTEYNFRGKLKWDPSSNLSLTYIQDNFNVDAGANYYVTVPDIFNPVNGPLQADDFSTYPNGDVEGESELSNSLSSLKVEFFKTNFRLQSVTSYNATKRYLLGENDYSQYAFSFVEQTSNSNTFSQEFRLISNDSKEDKLSYSLGMLFQNSDRYLNTTTYLNNTYYQGGFVDASAANAVYDPVGLIGNDDDNTITTFAVFAFLDYKLSSKLTLSAGLRFDKDKLINESRILGETKLETDISAIQPKVSISYEASKDVLVYTNYGRGYRSGGFNSAPTVKFDKEYKEEFTNNYELGIKTSFLNNRIIFNNAFYLIEFQNQQQYTFIPLASAILGIYNFEEATLKGFESEIKFRATNSLDFFAAIGINDGEIKKGTYNELTNAAAFDYTTSQTIDLAGNTSPFTSKSTFQIGANLNTDLSDNTNLNVSLNVENRGELYWDALETYVQDPYTLVNSKVSLQFKDFGLAIWARNITDTDYNQEFFPTAEFGFNNLRFPNTPRTFGVDLSYQF